MRTAYLFVSILLVLFTFPSLRLTYMLTSTYDTHPRSPNDASRRVSSTRSLLLSYGFLTTYLLRFYYIYCTILLGINLS